jgi:hypothetical protein
MRWGLAATKGARHWIHIDSDGLATNVDVLCGIRWWLLFTPSETFDLTNFGDLDQFFFEFDVTHPPNTGQSKQYISSLGHDCEWHNTIRLFSLYN